MSKLLEVPEVLSIAISALLLFMVQPRSGMASGLDDPSAVGPYLNGVFPSGLSNGGPPGLLSQTGAFTDLKSLEPAPGLVTYSVNSPLWSDRAEKLRWIALPNDGTHDTPEEQIIFDETENWSFPAGTVFVKHFELPVDAADSPRTVRLETRFLVCTSDGGKYGVTYRWLSDQSDAVLLNSAESGEYDVIDEDGAVIQQTWSFPGRSDCLICHNDASGQALGIKTFQLNGDQFYPRTRRIANQLKTWDHLGMFNQELEESAINNFMALRNINDLSAPLEHRVRSYLDSNCSHCHRPGGPGIGFDARLSTPLDTQGIINGAVSRPESLGTDAKYIYPGQVNKSAILDRMLRTGTTGMPPLAKNLVDTQAIGQFVTYITGLTESEFEMPSSTSARYVRFNALNEVLDGSAAAVAEFEVLDPGLDPIPISRISASSEAPGTLGNAFDGSPESFWSTDISEAYPHWLQVDMGSVRAIGGYRYAPRQGEDSDGRVDDWRVEVSSDGVVWETIDEVTGYGGTTESYQFSGPGGGRPVRASLAGPELSDEEVVEVTLIFDSDVSGVDQSDFSLINGTLLGTRGSRHYFTLEIQAESSEMEVALLENSVLTPSNSGNLATGPYSVTLIEKTPMSLWAGSNGLSGDYAGPLANPDRDNFLNFAEYAFDLDPRSPDGLGDDPDRPRPSVIEMEGGGRTLRIIFRRRIGASQDNLQYQAQFTSSLAGPETVWTESLNVVSADDLDSDWEEVFVEDPGDSSGSEARFGRVAVELQTHQ